MFACKKNYPCVLICAWFFLWIFSDILMVCLLIHISFLALTTVSDHQKTYFLIVLLLCSYISMVADGRILNLACLPRCESVKESTLVTPCHPGARKTVNFRTSWKSCPQCWHTSALICLVDAQIPLSTIWSAWPKISATIWARIDPSHTFSPSLMLLSWSVARRW